VRYLIHHETVLRFPKPVREHQCELRLAPRDDAGQRRVACAVEVEPDAPLRTHVDAFGNLVHRLSLIEPHERVRVRVAAEVETLLENPFAYAPLAPGDERGWMDARLRDDPSLHDFVHHRSCAVPDASALADCEPPAWAPDRTLLQNAQAAMAWAAATFRYLPGATPVHAGLADFAEQRAGVCQDFAHLMVSLVRSWGFAARYAVGYVDPGSVGFDDDQATHAWAEVLVPGAGWRGIDATAGLVANDSYVAVAAGRDSRDAAPVRGTFKGEEGGDSPHVTVRVARAAQEQQVQ
jgi:transglutaminase-like putative cysteine protease